jgi:hypothetical protein
MKSWSICLAILSTLALVACAGIPPAAQPSPVGTSPETTQPAAVPSPAPTGSPTSGAAPGPVCGEAGVTCSCWTQGLYGTGWSYRPCTPPVDFKRSPRPSPSAG